MRSALLLVLALPMMLAAPVQASTEGRSRGRIAVGTHAKRVRALNFQQVAHFPELGKDEAFFVVVINLCKQFHQATGFA